jgi:TonB-dependent receptor
LAKFSATDLSDAVIRIPGVSVANGQFAVIRGLSDRFLSTTVNGLKLPSPDPEKQAFQMDLLPSSAVGAVVVSKTYGPELWGESGGGNIDISTNPIPEENYVKVGAGLKANSNALDGGLDYSTRGSSGERFGFGTDNRLAPGELDPAWQYVPTSRGSYPLGTEFSAEIGRSVTVRDNSLGWRFAAENESTTKSRSGARQKFIALAADPLTGEPGALEDPSDPSKLVPDVRNFYDQSETESVTTFNGGVAYRFAQHHEVKFDALYVRSGIDTSYLQQNDIRLNSNLEFEGGENPTLDTLFFFQGNEYYRERELKTFQLSGEHEFPAAADLRVGWAAQTAEAGQTDVFLETRFASELADPYANYILSRNAAAPTALSSSWLENVESQDAGRLDFTLPRDLFAERESTLNFGVATDRSSRVVDGLTDFRQPADDITASDYGTLYSEFISGGDFSATSSSYPLTSRAEREIDAVYLGASLAATKRLKFIGGARLESFSISSSGGARWGNLTSNNFYSNEVAAGFGDLLGTTDLPGAQYVIPGSEDSIVPVSSDFEESNVLPAAGIVLDLPAHVTLRTAYSQTKGRPSAREISPFFNRSIETQNLVIGNPAIRPSTVDNYDVRVEWNPAPEDSIAVSLFHKRVAQPVEKILLTTTAGDVETWLNNPGTAELYGVELEFRHGIGRWVEALREFSVGGNFTYIDAEVEEIPIAVQSVEADFADPSKIKRSRRLYDQPEYIANADLTWRRDRWGTSATFAAYAVSDVLIASGLTNAVSIASADFDLYQRSHLRCDFILSQRLNDTFKLKFSVKNLFDPVLGAIYDREALGRVVERNSYRAGRDFSLSVSADF